MAISGAGRSSHHDEEEFGPSVFSDINITPLTDIFLVLLIIFMVGSSIVVEQAQGGGTGVRVDLLKGAAKEFNDALNAIQSGNKATTTELGQWLDKPPGSKSLSRDADSTVKPVVPEAK